MAERNRRQVEVAEREAQVIDLQEASAGDLPTETISVRIAILGDVPKVLNDVRTVGDVAQKMGLEGYEWRVNGYPATMDTNLRNGDAVIAVPNIDGGK